MDSRLRIIAGRLRNRAIDIPRDSAVRPALVLVRRVICDTLAPFVPDAAVLDLFAGTGAFVFELISRGAQSAVAIDLDRKMIASIEKNASRLGVSDQIEAINGDFAEVAAQLGRQGKKFDLVIIAPPFYGDFIERALKAIAHLGLLKTGGMAVAHYHKKDSVNRSPVGYELWKSKMHGNSQVDVFRMVS